VIRLLVYIFVLICQNIGIERKEGVKIYYDLKWIFQQIWKQDKDKKEELLFEQMAVAF
jgi:hypothetical protein